MIDDARLTTLLRRWNAGEQGAEAVLMQAMFPAFHALASSRLRRFANPQLCAGELVSETYLRLHWADIAWNGPDHFRGIVAQLMRNIIVDHERARLSEKRGGAVAHVPIDALEDYAADADVDQAFDRDLLREKLGALRRVDPHRGRVAELKILWGLTTEEIAHELAISRASVVRLWRATLAHFARRSDGDDVASRRNSCRYGNASAEPAL